VKRLVLENEVVFKKLFLKKELFSPEFDECLFEYCTFQHVEFQGATVFDSVFSDCQFENVLLYWGLFPSAQFKNCKFKDVIFAGVTLTEAHFSECTFHNVIFRPGNIGGGCDLLGTVFETCELSRCISINSNTNEDSFLPSNMVMKTVERSALDLVEGLPLSVDVTDNDD